MNTNNLSYWIDCGMQIIRIHMYTLKNADYFTTATISVYKYMDVSWTIIICLSHSGVKNIQYKWSNLQTEIRWSFPDIRVQWVAFHIHLSFQFRIVIYNRQSAAHLMKNECWIIFKLFPFANSNVKCVLSFCCCCARFYLNIKSCKNNINWFVFCRDSKGTSWILHLDC